MSNFLFRIDEKCSYGKKYNFINVRGIRCISAVVDRDDFNFLYITYTNGKTLEFKISGGLERMYDITDSLNRYIEEDDKIELRT